MKRRAFLKSTASAAIAGGVASSVLPALVAKAAPVKTGGSDRLGQIMPTRPFGQTGEQLTILGAGGAHIGRATEQDAQGVIETCLEGGVRFFDNAWRYSDGQAEKYYGQFLTPKYREDVFIMSKVNTQSREEAQKQLGLSLSRMKTDYLDLWLMHSVKSPEDVETRLQNGVLDVMLQAQADGKVRHIGFSGHVTVKAHLRLLELMGQRPEGDPFVACQMPLNPVDFAAEHSFSKQVIPELVKRPQYATLAMKTALHGNAMTKPHGQAIIPNRISLEENFWFALSLPVCSWISGMENAAMAKENIGIAKRFQSLAKADQLALAERVADIANQSGLEGYKRNA